MVGTLTYLKEGERNVLLGDKTMLMDTFWPLCSASPKEMGKKEQGRRHAPTLYASVLKLYDRQESIC